jgi:hypothetical protein
MAVVTIKDELDIETYIKALVATMPEIKAVKYVDVDADLEEMVKDYFTNHYKGTVLFWGNFEEKLSVRNSLSWSTPQLQATILAKYDKMKPGDLLAIRTATKKMMLRFIHKIKADQEDTEQESHLSPPAPGGGGYWGAGDSGKHWSFKLHNDLILPVGDIKDAGTRGWSIDFEIGFPVTEE